MQISTGPLRPVASRANTLEKLGALSLHSLPTPPSSATSDDDPESSAPVDGRTEKGEETSEDMSHIYACGDCAETGAIQAGHTAYWQAEVAARNILRMIKAEEEGKEVEELEEYKVSVPAIKVTLGLVSFEAVHRVVRDV